MGEGATATVGLLRFCLKLHQMSGARWAWRERPSNVKCHQDAVRITGLQGGQQSESSNEGVCSSRQVWLAYCPSQDVDVAVKIVNLDEPSINLVRDFPLSHAGSHADYASGHKSRLSSPLMDGTPGRHASSVPIQA